MILAGSAFGVEGGVGIGADTAIVVGTAGSFDVGFASPTSGVEGGVGIAVSLVGFAISLGVIGLGGKGNAGSFASRLATAYNDRSELEPELPIRSTPARRLHIG